MKRDRRDQARAGLGRRASGRVYDYREVQWREAGGNDEKFGWLVDRSAHGVAMLTDNLHAPESGARISVAVHRRHHDRFESAVVTRVEHLSSLLDLVTAEYTGPTGPVRRLRGGRRER